MRERNQTLTQHLGIIRRLVGGTLAAVFMLLPATVLSGQRAGAAQKAAPGETLLPGPLRLLLPPRIYAVPGIEMNVYFDNVCLAMNPANYVFDVTCAKGTQQTERWTFVPTKLDLGQYPLAIEVRDEANRLLARAETVLEVVPPDAGAGVPITFLTIGASETHAAVYPEHLLELCKTPGNPRVTLVGHLPDQKRPDVRIEGYGGWTAQRFMTCFKAEKRPEGPLDWRAWNACGSPFLYPDGQGRFKADFARYCQEFNRGKGPDFVTLTFGGNDVGSLAEEKLETGIDTMLQHFGGLIGMIRQVRKDTKIGAVLMYPPAASQDAFGANYQCRLKYWQCKRNLHRVFERMIQRYGNREAEHVYLVPVKSNLDCEHNFPTSRAPWNARTKVEGTRLSNALHPTADGYRQIGDTIYCWMKAQLSRQANR